MNILYIFAHPEPKSFNSSMKYMAIQTLEEKGNTVRLSDLYSMGFKPVLDQSDFLQRKKEDSLNLFLEQITASKEGTFSKDIMTEMEKVKWADCLIFQFPIFFTGMPAIMKGWLDRVFAAGFAFSPINDRVYENGLLKGKKTMMAISTGAEEDWYSPSGKHGDIRELLKYINHCTFEYVGMEVLDMHLTFGTGKMSVERGDRELKRYRDKLNSLFPDS
ncbi:NAD(P)H-dependent oxidoreductase [Methanolobus sp.]|jgi:NAD(P)H dehydrogenase (quinone)|uniref:NAD(P)H-dependent oxidoreductase n=1 Tax=Methanolobus sp. TaxID=1874737 RepID=UPI0025E0AFB1|nr:NAD(P)H-dependent oxidoreductase [Methanolobus sp.]